MSKKPKNPEQVHTDLLSSGQIVVKGKLVPDTAANRDAMIAEYPYDPDEVEPEPDLDRLIAAADPRFINRILSHPAIRTGKQR